MPFLDDINHIGLRGVTRRSFLNLMFGQSFPATAGQKGHAQKLIAFYVVRLMGQLCVFLHRGVVQELGLGAHARDGRQI